MQQLWEGFVHWLRDGGVYSVIFPALFALLAYLFQRRARQDQHVLQTENLRATLDQQVISWGSAVIELIAEAESLSRAREQPAFAEQQERLVTQLSAAADKGRMYFPNASHDLVGLDREWAMRGYRQPILDTILLVHDRLQRMSAATPDQVNYETDQLFKARRAFVSLLQRALDPRRRELLLENLKRSQRQAALKDDIDWDGVKPLVEEYEKQYGPGAFWKDPPRTRQEILQNRSQRAA